MPAHHAGHPPMPLVFMSGVCGAMACFVRGLTWRWTGHSKVLRNRNAATGRSRRCTEMRLGADGNLVVAVPVQYASWGTFEAIASEERSIEVLTYLHKQAHRP